MNLADLKNEKSDRQLINDWLEKINETDPACRQEVLDACANDKSARAYYLEQAKGFQFKAA